MKSASAPLFPAVKVVFLDPNSDIRDGVRKALTPVSDLQLSLAESEDEALRMIESLRPHVVVVNARLRLTGELRRRAGPNGRISVIVLATRGREDMVQAELADGAAGHVPREHVATRLPTAIRIVAAGGLWPAAQPSAEPVCHPEVSAPIAAIQGRLASLSPRQYEVLVLYALGLRRLVIASQLVIAPATVQSHLYRAKDRLEAADLALAVTAILLRHLVQAGRVGLPNRG